MLSFFSNNSSNNAEALVEKVKTTTTLNLQQLKSELATAMTAQSRLEGIQNELAAHRQALSQAQTRVANFTDLNAKVSHFKQNFKIVLEQKKVKDLLANLDLVFNTHATTDSVEQINFVRLWQLEFKSLVINEGLSGDLHKLTLAKIQNLIVNALSNMFISAERMKMDATREYYFKVVMRYIFRNKLQVKINAKELLKKIENNLSSLIIEDAKDLQAYISGGKESNVHADTKMLINALKELLTPADVKIVVNFLITIPQGNYSNDHKKLLQAINQLLAKSYIKDVNTSLTDKEQKDLNNYELELRSVELAVQNQQYTPELAQAFIKNLFAQNESTAAFVADYKVETIKAIAQIFNQAANPSKAITALEALVHGTKTVLQAHEYVENFIGPVQDVQQGSYEAIFLRKEFELPVELLEYDVVEMMETMNNLQVQADKICDLEEQRKAVSGQFINDDIEMCVANALINTVYRALQLTNNAKNQEINRKISQGLEKLVESNNGSPDLTTVIKFVINIFHQFENYWTPGKELQEDSVDTYLLKLLFNTGTPKGLFISTFSEIQAAYADKNTQISTYPVSELQGDVVQWLSGSLSSNPLRLRYEDRQKVREQAKLNLFNLQKALVEHKSQNPRVVADELGAEVEACPFSLLI